MGDGPRKVDPNQTAEHTIEMVRRLFEATKEQIAASPKASDNRIVSEVVDQIQTAITVCYSILVEANHANVKRIEFDQTARSLNTLPLLASKYASDPTPQNHQTLLQLSGHIVDRICQKILEDCGKKGLEDYFARVQKTLGEFEALLGILNSSALTLSSYTNVIATNALHEDFKNDADRYERGAERWLIMSAIPALFLIMHLFYSATAVNELASQVVANTNRDLSVGLTLLLLTPKIAISAILAIVTISFWRNYQSYRHLTVASKAKLNIARIVPLIALNLKQSGEVSALHLEFLRQIAVPGDSGFLANAKNKIGLGVGSTNVSM